MKETYSIITHPHGSCVDCDGRHQGRINWIDWAKAIGIFLVVTGHSHYYCEHVVPLIFMIHMPLFFVVSGYLFKTSGSVHELFAVIVLLEFPLIYMFNHYLPWCIGRKYKHR